MSKSNKKKTSCTLDIWEVTTTARPLWYIAGTAIPYILDVLGVSEGVVCRSGMWETGSRRTASILMCCREALVLLATQRREEAKA